MKPNGGIAKASKHHGRHKNARPRKHEKLDKHEGRNKNVNDASLAFEQIRRSLGSSQTNDALLPSLRWPEQRFHGVAAPLSGVGKRRAKLQDGGRDVSRAPPSSSRTGLVDNPLMQPIPWPHPDDSARPFGSRRSVSAEQGLWTRPGHETWQINVRWTTGLSAVVNTCRVTVRDWHTQRFLTSADLDPYRQDSAVACLERLSRRKGMPHAMVMDYQPDMLAVVEQWAFAHGVMLVICQWRRPWGEGSVQLS